MNFKNICIEPSQKVAWITRTIAAALLCGFAFSGRLWITSRLFPLAPVSDSLPAIPPPMDYGLMFLLAGLLLAIIMAAKPAKFILLFVALAVLWCLWDQTRWQPWLYQYLAMLTGLGLYAGKNDQEALNCCRLVMICTYFWSGLQKLNINFARETWPDIAGSLFRFLPPVVRNLPAFVVLSIPLLEICVGLGLATRRYRNAAVALAAVTHVFILVLLASSGENTVVWPWNLAMVFFVVMLFWQDRQTAAPALLFSKRAFHRLVLLLFGLMPVLSFFNLFDSYLSLALYSGNTDQAVIYVTPAVIDMLPAAIHPHIWQQTSPFFLDINRWAYGELNVPVYPEPRIYRKVAEQICSYAMNSPDVRLRIKEKPNPFTGARRSEYYDCGHLQEVGR